MSEFSVPPVHVKYEGLDQTFLEAFPEFIDAYMEEFDYWVDWDKPPGMYLILPILVFPHIVLLLDTRQDQQLLQRLFIFFENMAFSKDRRVIDLLGIEVVHKLLYDRNRLQKAWVYMGTETRELAIHTSKILGLPVDCSEGLS